MCEHLQSFNYSEQLLLTFGMTIGNSHFKKKTTFTYVQWTFHMQQHPLHQIVFAFQNAVCFHLLKSSKIGLRVYLFCKIFGNRTGNLVYRFPCLSLRYPKKEQMIGLGLCCKNVKLTLSVHENTFNNFTPVASPRNVLD